MLDDDIVCLGSIPASDRALHRPVSGVTLHVQRSGENDGYSMSFKRSKASVVQIGRRSGSEADNIDSENAASAMFRCAVVSRKHAKMVFSDSGHVYIVDSGSHHGTHIRKLGEIFSKALKPETSTMLNDGDIITFGKPVGKGDDWVRPVTARVQLSYGPSTFKPLSVPSPSSSEKSKSCSGRYGIDDQGFSSSDESYSSYSDIEEIPAPTTSPSKATSQSQNHGISTSDAMVASASQNQMSSAYSAIRRLLSPAMRKLPSVSEIIGDRSLVPSFASPEEPESMPTSPPRQLEDAYIVFDASRHDDQVPRIRSNSPMDLGSPSPVADVIVSRPLSIPPPHLEVILPVSPDDSVQEEELSNMVDRIEAQVGQWCESASSPTSPQPRLAHDASLPDSTPSSSSVNLPTPGAIPQPEVAQKQTQSQSYDIAEILDTVHQLESSVHKLHTSRRKYKSRFNANVSFISRRLSEIDDKFAEVDAECNVLCDQMEGVQHTEVPDLAEQVDELRERVDAFDWGGAGFNDMVPLEERDDVKASIKALHDLVDEMHNLRDRTEAAMSKEMSDIRTMREQALKDIAKAKADIAAAATVQTPVLTSLKRKRDDTNENEGRGLDDGDESEFFHVRARERTESVNGSFMVAAMDEGIDSNVDGAVDSFMDELVRPDAPPPRKRPRRLVSIATQTATAITIGAALTWTALAFS